jgi:hypothetical protein
MQERQILFSLRSDKTDWVLTFGCRNSALRRSFDREKREGWKSALV